MNKIKVNLAERSYEIQIGMDALENLGSRAKQLNLGAKVLVLTDPLVKKHYGGAAKSALARAGFKTSLAAMPRGEKSKNLKTAQGLYELLVKFNLQRDDTLVVLGGGVVGDMGGFIAGTYMRGINLIQVPTTLLAQVDSAIGGKTGVDLVGGKNLVGIFYQPRLVLIDLRTLATLAAREVANGLAEVVKYGVIKSSTLFEKLERNEEFLTAAALRKIGSDYKTFAVWQSIVTECAAIKAAVVEEDERESGSRMILNFGHTVGHAIEAATHYAVYSHGEAIALGMVAAANLAVKLGLFEVQEALRLKKLLQVLGLPIALRSPLAQKEIMAFLQRDKKAREGKVQFVLPKKIGEVIIFRDAPLSFLEPILEGMGCR